jgi:hypothetical protein
MPHGFIALLPRVHRLVSLPNRWFLGTQQGAVGGEHLDYYHDELTFRFNRCKSVPRGKLFYRLVNSPVSVWMRGGEILKVHFQIDQGEVRRSFFEGDVHMIYEAEM